MRIEFNPRHITSRLGPWKGFLTGSLIMTSFAILFTTENEFVFLGMVAFIFAGIVLLLESLLRGGEEIPFLAIIVMFVVGMIFSIVISFLGLAYLYFAIVIILIILTYTPRESLKRFRKSE
ncbi:MAG: hypothetical protein GTN76_01710 [Candidatus Aenigmarchaeota archaeon]|nr:hypothetical protein [Candidatus Aenigmarchaeota archaeon]